MLQRPGIEASDGSRLPSEAIPAAAEQMLQHARSILAQRGDAYGDAATSFATIAARWSLTLGHQVTPAQVVVCLLDLKITRLAHDPKHYDSAVDIVGYAALLPEVTRP
jgi:Domain of unknown function (DUF6378)